MKIESIDDIAYGLLNSHRIEVDGKIFKIGKEFFINHKDYFPYNTYYEDAKLILRNKKIKKIMENLVDSKKGVTFVSK